MTSGIRSRNRRSTPAADDRHVVLAGYRLLRLGRVRWRAAAAGLSAPLMRLVQLRQVQSRAWQAAIVEHDHDDQTRSGERGGELCA